MAGTDSATRGCPRTYAIAWRVKPVDKGYNRSGQGQILERLSRVFAFSTAFFARYLS